MTRFSSWPRWAIDLARAALSRVRVLEHVVFEMDLECCARDTVTFVDDEDVSGWPCPGSREWN